MQPLMLCIHMDKERSLRLSLAAMARGIRAQIVETSREGQPLGVLCGLDDPLPRPPQVQVPEEMLVFAFLDEEGLSGLLTALRAGGLPPVRLKAVLTQTNRQWNCGMLYRELKSEAAALGK